VAGPKSVPPPAAWTDEELEAAKKLLAGELPPPPEAPGPSRRGLVLVGAGALLVILAVVLLRSLAGGALALVGAVVIGYGVLELTRRPQLPPEPGGLRVGGMTFADRPELMLAVMEQQAMRQAGKARDEPGD
jgi:hypothetical protein